MIPNPDVALLIKLLLSKSAPVEERDDAAMDLGTYNDDDALNALIEVATDKSEHEMVLVSCGESIGDIWRARGCYSRHVFDSLALEAKQVVNIDLQNIKEVL